MCQNTDQPQANLKTGLRRELRRRRRELSQQSRVSFDQAIRRHLRQLIKDHAVESLAAYWPFDGEPDLTLLCKQLIADGKKIALPIISEQNDTSMRFHLWQLDSALRKNQYGIFEPQKTATVSLADFDMMLMPLVAYDRYGSRIGMGSGYYDRHLESIRNLTRPLRVGIAYSLQETAPFTKNDWDIPLHGIVNERGWFTFDT